MWKGVKKEMDVFYLASGLILLFLSGAHALWGEKHLVSDLENSNINKPTGVGFYISYHQITSTLLVSGLTLIAIALFDSISGIDTLALFITILLFGNILAFTIISLIKQKDLFIKTIPQLVMFVIAITLIILGIII